MTDLDRQNDNNLEPFCGCGTTIDAAEKNGRDWIGIDVTQLNYSGKVRTGNGIAEVAPVTIETITVGEITLRNVAGSVSRRGALRDNLLGQTFLARLAAFNVEKNRLVLRGY